MEELSAFEYCRNAAGSINKVIRGRQMEAAGVRRLCVIKRDTILPDAERGSSTYPKFDNIS
jgi:hypothetical protein